MGIAEIFPEATIFTSLFDPKILKFAPNLEKYQIKTTFLQKFPLKRLVRRLLLPLYPIAFETFNFDGFDLVISSSARFAHGVITKPNQLHIAYVNSPPRFLWETKNYLEGERLKILIKVLAKPLLGYLRNWDRVASSRPDVILANSENVAGKIKEIYGRESEVLYPFVDLERFLPLATGHSIKNYSNGEKRTANSYFLVVSRLLSWKKIDIAIEVCKRLNLGLKVVGDGPDKKRLRKMASENIQFLPNIDDEKLRELYQNCKAVILTQEEDFGLVALEAQALGKPLIAYGFGGSLETIIDGETGIFYQEQKVESLVKAIEKFAKINFEASNCLANAGRFSKANFQNRFRGIIRNAKTK